MLMMRQICFNNHGSKNSYKISLNINSPMTSSHKRKKA